MKTLCVKKAEVLLNLEDEIKVEAEISIALAAPVNTSTKSAISFLEVVSSTEIPTCVASIALKFISFATAFTIAAFASATSTTNVSKKTEVETFIPAFFNSSANVFAVL